MPVIPATQEAEAGELLEPSGRQLQWAAIVPLNSSLGNERNSISKKKKKKKITKDQQNEKLIFLKKDKQNWQTFGQTIKKGRDDPNKLNLTKHSSSRL